MEEARACGRRVSEEWAMGAVADGGCHDGTVRWGGKCKTCIVGLVVEYVVAIDVPRVRFPADAFV